jgi:hypothetical protein
LGAQLKYPSACPHHHASIARAILALFVLAFLPFVAGNQGSWPATVSDHAIAAIWDEAVSDPSEDLAGSSTDSDGDPVDTVTVRYARLDAHATAPTFLRSWQARPTYGPCAAPATGPPCMTEIRAEHA